MGNFEYWYHHVADMPEKDANGWYDLETGLRYDPNADYDRPSRSARGSISIKAQEARNKAKFLGAKALSGSLKQKEWAEKIRAEKLASMIEEDAKLVCEPTGIPRLAKFWIENRGRSSTDIVKFVREYKLLAEQAKDIQAQYEASESEILAEQYREIAKKYNNLTAEWGFKDDWDQKPRTSN